MTARKKRWSEASAHRAVQANPARGSNIPHTILWGLDRRGQRVALGVCWRNIRWQIEAAGSGSSTAASSLADWPGGRGVRLRARVALLASLAC